MSSVQDDKNSTLIVICTKLYIDLILLQHDHL